MNDLRLGSIDMNLLVVLDAVLRERSVQRAAERLGLTPSAVSHALRRLRELVGDPLLVRTPRGMVPTARAERIAPRLGRALAELSGALDDEDRFDPREARRTFNVSVAPRGGPGSLVDSALARLGHRRDVALVVPHFLLAPLIVAETDLVLMVPSRLGRRYESLLPVRLLPSPLLLEAFTLAQVWHERAHHDPAHAWLRQIVARAAGTARATP
jgi:DNA-binding transcriptional LysR family regulator